MGHWGDPFLHLENGDNNKSCFIKLALHGMIHESRPDQFFDNNDFAFSHRMQLLTPTLSPCGLPSSLPFKHSLQCLLGSHDKPNLSSPVTEVQGLIVFFFQSCSECVKPKSCLILLPKQLLVQCWMCLSPEITSNWLSMDLQLQHYHRHTGYNLQGKQRLSH